MNLLKMMKPYMIGLAVVVGIAGTSVAQTAADLNEGLTISYDSLNDEVSVRWWSKANFYYFLLETSDLVDDPWAYFPYATAGSDTVKGVILTASADKMFFRVELTNDNNSPLLVLDQDGDKVSTVDELLQGTDPFLSQSLDADTIPDDWEIFHGLDTTQGVDSSGDDDEPDGASIATEFALNLNPSERDHPDLNLNLY